MEKKISFTNITWKEGNYYVAQCLNIDVSSFGKNKKEALKNIEEAIALYLEDRKHEIHQIKSPSIVVRPLQHA